MKVAWHGAPFIDRPVDEFYAPLPQRIKSTPAAPALPVPGGTPRDSQSRRQLHERVARVASPAATSCTLLCAAFTPSPTLPRTTVVAHCLTPMNDPSDDQLMRAFAGGDGHAFERLYARHRQPLYRFVRRLLGQTAAAQVDEVFQDTWMRAIEARDSWRAQGAAFRTWLFTIAHHRAIDCLRKSGREVQLDCDDDDRSGAPFEAAEGAWSAWPATSGQGSSGAEDRLFWRRAGERLLGCLEGLPLPQRAAFLLHHEDGLSLDEMARALEVGFETAKTRLRYAMAKLRACMGAYLPEGATR
jgi:RNA polymerase sigma factor (sigma-70 family)